MNATETSYPITFRAQDAKILGDHLKHRNSVNIVGMKRVGINNFLRFFFSHQDVPKTYLDQEVKYLFVTIDLNDLVEREVYPFWTLTLKRLIDTIDATPNSAELKKQSRKLFVESIQLKDLFVTVDSVRKIVSHIVGTGYYPILLFNRFDRMKDSATAEFFGNLQSLKDHAQRNISFVFTSYRPLYELKPDVFTKQALSVFCHDMYLKPAEKPDSDTILKTLETRYQVQLPEDLRGQVIELSGGHVQYLHLSILKLRDAKDLPTDRPALLEFLLNNEEASLLSEELLDSLTEKERNALYTLAGEDKNMSFLSEVPYLTNTGMVRMFEEKPIVFSPILRQAIVRRANNKQNNVATDFTKKEHLLFTYLKSHEGELCEREAIIEAVWPDYAESGVSDWAIDRLVARVRVKLKNQNSPFEIQTVITRGYKLVAKG